MIRGRLPLSVFLILLGGAAQAAPAPKPDSQYRVYRIIRASPQDFVYAIKAPFRSEAQIKALPQGSGASRLEKFFRIADKQIHGDVIRVTLAHRVSFLPGSTERSPTVTVILTEDPKKRLTNEFFFDAKFETTWGTTIASNLLVHPNEQGALLELVVNKTNLSDRSLQAFMKMAVALGFFSDKMP